MWTASVFSLHTSSISWLCVCVCEKGSCWYINLNSFSLSHRKRARCTCVNQGLERRLHQKSPCFVVDVSHRWWSDRIDYVTKGYGRGRSDWWSKRPAPATSTPSQRSVRSAFKAWICNSTGGCCPWLSSHSMSSVYQPLSHVSPGSARHDLFTVIRSFFSWLSSSLGFLFSL